MKTLIGRIVRGASEAIRGKSRLVLAAAVGATALCAGGSVMAETVLDLTSNSAASGFIGGAKYQNMNQQPTGTGVIKPFLTIQQKGFEQGYNTDNGTLQFDEKRQPNWTRSLAISELAHVDLNGNVIANPTTGNLGYVEVLLDINEANSSSKQLLSMRKFQVFVHNNPNITGYVGASPTDGASTDHFSSPSTLVYDMDANATDYRVDLQYDFNSGSGSGDLYVFVPWTVFAGRSEQYLTLFSSFGKTASDPNGSGSPYASDAGFEEWAVRTGTSSTTGGGPSAVPLPSTASAGMGLFGSCLAAAIWRKRRSLATAE